MKNDKPKSYVESRTTGISDAQLLNALRLILIRVKCRGLDKGLVP